MARNMEVRFIYLIKSFKGVMIHPETIKSLETVHYHLTHNIPIRRELLYECVPELFTTEMEELDKIDKAKLLAKRPRLDDVEIFFFQKFNEIKLIYQDYKFFWDLGFCV